MIERTQDNANGNGRGARLTNGNRAVAQNPGYSMVLSQVKNGPPDGNLDFDPWPSPDFLEKFSDRDTINHRPLISPAGAADELRQLQQKINRLLAKQVAVVEASINAEVPRRDGYTSATAFVKHCLATSGGSAQKLVRASFLGDLPLVGEAFEAGLLSLDMVLQLARTVTADSEEAKRSEGELLERALECDLVTELADIVDDWISKVAPQEVEDIKAIQRQARGVFVSELDSGMARLTWYERGEVIGHVRSQLETHAPNVADGRTHAQIMSDTLTDLVLGDAANRSQLVIHVDEAILRYQVGGLAEDRDGHQISIEEARRLACDTTAGRYIHGPRKVPLEIGRNSRRPKAHQRIALEARDRHCRFPFCDRRVRWCEAHHIVHWIDDGPTDLDNLVLLCRFHHGLVHEGGYRIKGIPEDFEIIAPDGLVYGQSSLRPESAWPMKPLEMAHNTHQRPRSAEEKYRYVYQARQWARRGLGERPAPLDLMDKPDDP